MDKLLKDLNESQKEAVLATEGPVMAIAGAGSGKTRVLTRRMAHLIFNLGVPAHRILAITFTNKAANEMKTRVAKLLGISTSQMWVSTFHSMCARILREHIDLLGYDRRFQIIDDDDVTQMVKVILKQLNIDPKMVKPKMLKTHVLNVKADPSLIDDYDEPLRGYLNHVFPAYQKQLKNSNLVDFEDLLVLTIELLKKYPEIKKQYHGLFQYVMVDEFQDTNNVQYDLIRLLVNEQNNVFIVGDEDQSIYAFRGANIDNIRKFERNFPKVKRILLEQNYRSTNTILKASNDVIRGNRNRIEKNLFSTQGEGEPVTFFKGYTYRDETEYVAEMIRELVFRHNYQYEEIAVLYRANATSRAFEDTFMQKHIPYQVVGNTSFFKRKEIKDIVAYLRLILNPNDSYSLTRIVNEPRRGIGAKTIERLSIFADKEQDSLFEAISLPNSPLGKAPLSKLKTFRDLILSLKEKLDVMEFNDFIDELLVRTGYREMLRYDDMGDVRYENIMELKTMIQETKKSIEDADKIDVLTYVLEEIALKSAEDEKKETNVVTLMTLHAAKGLEFKAVFIVACEQGMFPLYRSMESPKDLEEERRLMYVGMTRAMERLYLTNCRQRQLYGETQMHQDSMFLSEININHLKLEGLNKAVSREYTPSKKRRLLTPESTLETVDNDLSKGDRINHTAFGRGVVISVSGDQCVIAFAKEHGIKTLLKNHKAIKKV